MYSSDRQRDIENLETFLFGHPLDSVCLDGGRPRLSPHPLDSLRHSLPSIDEGAPTRYVEMDLETEEITYHSYKK
ncbi:MAG: hypothetical protein AABX54_02695 [Nanoarchaeota archaeon]